MGLTGFTLLCAAELRKLRGRGLLYAVLLFGAAHGLAAGAGLKAMELLGDKFSEGQGGQSIADPIDFSIVGEFALNLAITPVNGFALLLLFSILWAEDFSLGTMAVIFSRPVHRWRIFAAKFVVALVCGAASISLAVVTGLALGLVLFGITGDVSLLDSAPMVGWMAQFPAITTRLLHTTSGVVLGTLLLLPAIAVTALVGNVTRSPIMTLFGAMLGLFADFFVHSVLSLWGTSELDSAPVAQALSRWNIWAGRDLFEVHGPWAAAWTTPLPGLDSANLNAVATGLPASFWSLFGQPLLATILWGVVLAAVAVAFFCKRDVT